MYFCNTNLFLLFYKIKSDTGAFNTHTQKDNIESPCYVECVYYVFLKKQSECIYSRSCFYFILDGY